MNADRDSFEPEFAADSRNGSTATGDATQVDLFCEAAGV